MASEPNMQIVDVLVDLHALKDVHPREWKHFDGSPITADELALVLQAATADYQAATVLLNAKAHSLQFATGLAKRIEALMQPYLDSNPEIVSLRAVLPLMPSAERREVAELIHLLRGARP